MAAFEDMVETLNNLGFFTYLAYFLLLILLYYLFIYLLKEYVKWLQNETYRKVLSAVFSALVVVLLYTLFASAAGEAAAFASMVVIVLVAFFFLIALIMKIMNVDLFEKLRKS